MCCAVLRVVLQSAGLVDAVDLSQVDRLSMACPALPLCGLAITEAERGLPDINRCALRSPGAAYGCIGLCLGTSVSAVTLILLHVR